MECIGCGTYFLSTFCPGCGKANKQVLRSIDLVGFHGVSSLSPSMEKFWATGDPDVLDQKL